LTAEKLASDTGAAARNLLGQNSELRCLRPCVTTQSVVTQGEAKGQITHQTPYAFAGLVLLISPFVTS
tara:strand:+ start:2592 stop:2795 length:204 start_codon:yes stop_codon:yes gene_type:complete